MTQAGAQLPPASTVVREPVSSAAPTSQVPSSHAPGASTPAASPAPKPSSDDFVLSPIRAAVEAEAGFHIGLRGIDERTLASMPVDREDGPGNVVTDGGAGGYRPEIGLVTGDQVAMLASDFDPRAVASVTRTALNAKNWPMHVRVKATGQLAKPWQMPDAWLDGGPTLTVTPASSWQHDTAHQPHRFFVLMLYLRKKGDAASMATYRTLLEEMRAEVYKTFFQAPPQSRGLRNDRGAGVIMPQAGAYQPRGAAWVLASLVQFFVLLPKNDEAYPWVRRAVEQNARFLRASFIDGSWDYTANAPSYDAVVGSLKNDLVFFSPGLGQGYGDKAEVGERAIGSGFQQAFQCGVYLWIAGLDLDVSAQAKADIDAVAAGAAKYLVTLFGPADTKGAFDYRRAGLYVIATGHWAKDAQGRFYNAFAKTPGELFALQNQPPLGPDDFSFRYGSQENPNRELGGFEASYVSNLMWGLAFAVDQRRPGAAEAWERVRRSKQYRVSVPVLPFAYAPKGEYFPASPPGRTGATSAADAPPVGERKASALPSALTGRS